MGAVTCAGIGCEPLWRRVLEGHSLVENGLARIPDAVERELERELRLPLGRFTGMVVHAIRQAMGQAGWAELTPEDGLVLGTTTGNILEWESHAIRAGAEPGLDPLTPHQPLSVAASQVRAALGFHGPVRILSTACSSSTQAIAVGATWVRRKKVRRCLVGGAEVLSRLTIEGFRCLQLLSPRPATPFDADRSGINLAEGAAFLCLEPTPPARARPLAFLSGWGTTSDAHHMTAPHPEGRGCYEAMALAVSSAGITVRDVSWIHAHGTGSPANDLSESLAIERFAAESPGSEAPYVSSTKGIHGHALGASGAIELTLSIRALAEERVPATFGLRRPDPKIRLRHPSGEVRTSVSHLLKNSLGFGGANASLLLSRVGRQ